MASTYCISSDFGMAALDHLDQGVTVFEYLPTGGVLRYVNPAYARLIEYDVDELIGKSSAFLGKFCLNPNTLLELQDTLRRGEQATARLQLRSRTGKILWFELTAIPIIQSGRNFVMFIHHDITDIESDKDTMRKRCDILAERNQELEELSVHDPLTGLYNRRFFDPDFIRLHGYHSRRKSNIAIAFIDVDYFKNFNDVYGHAQGDVALKALAHCLAEHFSRVEDLCVRWGGEEFVVVTGDEKDPETVLSYFESFRHKVEDLRIENTKPHRPPLGLTVSIGVYFGVPGADADPAAVLRAADEAMYRAKKQGRNCTVMERSINPLSLVQNEHCWEGKEDGALASAANGHSTDGR